MAFSADIYPCIKCSSVNFFDNNSCLAQNKIPYPNKSAKLLSNSQYLETNTTTGRKSLDAYKGTKGTKSLCKDEEKAIKSTVPKPQTQNNIQNSNQNNIDTSDHVQLQDYNLVRGNTITTETHEETHDQKNQSSDADRISHLKEMCAKKI